MTDSVYWIWFSRMFGVGSRRGHMLLEYFSGPEEIYREISAGGRAFGMLTPNELAATGPSLEWAYQTQRRTLRKGCDIITPDHPDYPPQLQTIFAKPAALYVKGDLKCLRDALAIGMVGTRTYSDYGRDAARLLAGELGRCGAVVVSGLARGIDTFCHQAALAAGGKSIGILGCGIDVDYPGGSAELKRALSQNGAVVAEYPLGTEPSKHNFPLRNRLISGMSHGVVVVEAGIKSGSMLTAAHATEQDRELFAVPGNLFDAGAQGGNSLIRDGAKLTQCAADIIEEFEHMPFAGLKRPVRPAPPRYEQGAAIAQAQEEMQRGTARKQRAKPERKAGERQLAPAAAEDGGSQIPAEPRAVAASPVLPGGCSPEAVAVYSLIGAQPVTFEDLAGRCTLNVPALQTALTELEIYGLIRGQPGRKFATC